MQRDRCAAVRSHSRVRGTIGPYGERRGSCSATDRRGGPFCLPFFVVFDEAYALVSTQIRYRYYQIGCYSIMIVFLVAVLSLLFPSLLAAPKVEMPAQITLSLASKPSQLERIRAALAAEITAGTMSVEPYGSWIAIRISNGSLFASGESQVIPTSIKTLRKVADVVEAEKGPLRIVGYTDDVPIRSGRHFRDNQALSEARADEVAAVIRPALSERGRITVAGRGAVEPITENATVQGRALNRRVEILVTRQP